MPVRPTSLRLLLLSVPSVVLGTGAFAQAEPSDPDAIFLPGDRVPLSEFLLGSPGMPMVLHVHPSVVSWAALEGSPIRVAVLPDSGSYALVVPSSVDGTTGSITYTPTRPVRAVVVTDALRSDLPIVTHWNAEGFGRQDRDKTDGIAKIQFDPEKPDFVFSGTVEAKKPYPTDPIGRPLFYKADQYALFSDGTPMSPDINVKVPSYERYIAENWSVEAVEDLAAVRLSDLARTWTGYPLAHRNPTPAFDPGAPLSKRLREGLPAMQLVHNYIVEHDDPAIPGSESCLASFVVPPQWSAATPAAYSVFLSSVYGIQGSMFSIACPWIEVVGDLAAEGLPAISVLMNGGGALACLTQQRSIYDCVEQLFDEAEALLAIDRTRVVVQGGSRGGTAALALSSNPYNDAFTARYVQVVNPSTFVGNGFEQHANPTYGLIQRGTDAHSGYVGSWSPLFEAPSTLDGVMRSGPDLAAETMYGTHDFGVIDACRSPGSPPFAGGFPAQTHVVLSAGTHDHAKPFEHMTRYNEELVAAQVPTRFEVHYRAGHGSLSSTGPDLMELMRRTITNEHDDFEAGVYHFHPIDDQDELAGIGTEFDPSLAPVVLEAPYIAALGQEHTYTVAGPPGTQYLVVVAPIDFEAYVAIQPLVPGTPVLMGSGTLPGAPPGVELTANTHTVAVPVELSIVGGWLLGLGYTVPGGTFVATSEETSMPPPPVGLAAANAAPVVYFGWYWSPSAPTPPPPDYLTPGFQSKPHYTLPFSKHSRTGGISTDTLFSP